VRECQKPSEDPFGTIVTPSVRVFGKIHTLHSPAQLPEGVVLHPSPFCVNWQGLHVNKICTNPPEVVYDLCMMPLMVKEADLNRINVPEDYEVLDATALGRRLGFKRDTVLAYLSRRNFRRIPRPNCKLAMGPIWYEKSVREWEANEEDWGRGK
jgi:hypothetical protein